MSSEGGGGWGPGCMFGLSVLGILAVLWIIWYYSGGPARYEATHGPFLKEPAPIDTGEVYGPSY